MDGNAARAAPRVQAANGGPLARRRHRRRRRRAVVAAADGGAAGAEALGVSARLGGARLARRHLAGLLLRRFRVAAAEPEPRLDRGDAAHARQPPRRRLADARRAGSARRRDADGGDRRRLRRGKAVGAVLRQNGRLELAAPHVDGGVRRRHPPRDEYDDEYPPRRLELEVAADEVPLGWRDERGAGDVHPPAGRRRDAPLAPGDPSRHARPPLQRGARRVDAARVLREGPRHGEGVDRGVDRADVERSAALEGVGILAGDARRPRPPRRHQREGPPLGGGGDGAAAAEIGRRQRRPGARGRHRLARAGAAAAPRWLRARHVAQAAQLGARRLPPQQRGEAPPPRNLRQP